MSSHEGYIVESRDFSEDCSDHQFPNDDLEAVKISLLLAPAQGHSIRFAAADRLKIKCAELRVTEWIFDRSGALTRAHILYVHVPDTWPLYLLRLEVDETSDPVGPFNDPSRWPRWAEMLGEIAEATMRLWV